MLTAVCFCVCQLGPCLLWCNRRAFRARFPRSVDFFGVARLSAHPRRRQHDRRSVPAVRGMLRRNRLYVPYIRIAFVAHSTLTHFDMRSCCRRQQVRSLPPHRPVWRTSRASWMFVMSSCMPLKLRNHRHPDHLCVDSRHSECSTNCEQVHGRQWPQRVSV
jgi:hypothetical protein